MGEGVDGGGALYGGALSFSCQNILFRKKSFLVLRSFENSFSDILKDICDAVLLCGQLAR